MLSLTRGQAVVWPKFSASGSEISLNVPLTPRLAVILEKLGKSETRERQIFERNEVYHGRSNFRNVSNFSHENDLCKPAFNNIKVFSFEFSEKRLHFKVSLFGKVVLCSFTPFRFNGACNRGGVSGRAGDSAVQFYQYKMVAQNVLCMCKVNFFSKKIGFDDSFDGTCTKAKYVIYSKCAHSKMSNHLI